MLSLRQKQLLNTVGSIADLKHIFKQWLNYVGIKFLQNRETTEKEEVILEEIIDFYYDYIDKIENDRSFLKKVSLGSVQLPPKKKKAKK